VGWEDVQGSKRGGRREMERRKKTHTATEANKKVVTPPRTGFGTIREDKSHISIK
jgi:hypothetical protein